MEAEEWARQEAEEKARIEFEAGAAYDAEEEARKDAEEKANVEVAQAEADAQAQKKADSEAKANAARTKAENAKAKAASGFGEIWAVVSGVGYVSEMFLSGHHTEMLCYEGKIDELAAEVFDDSFSKPDAFIEITTSEVLMQIETDSKRLLELEESRVLFKASSVDEVNDIMETIRFCQNCPKVEGNVHWRVFVDIDDDPDIEDFVDVFEMDQKIPKALNYKKQTLIGSVIDEEGPVSGVSVSARFFGCSETWTDTTNRDGRYSVEVAVLKNYMPKTARFTYTKDDYNNAWRTLQVGGLPLVDNKEVSDTYMPRNDDTGELKISFTDADTGKTISPKISWVNERTGEEGSKLKKLSPGNYLVRAEKSDYFTLYKPLWVMNGAKHELEFSMVSRKNVNSSKILLG